MLPNDIKKNMREKMERAIQAFNRNLATVRAGRAISEILDNINVDYYGSPTPLNQLTQVITSEARLLVITPFNKTAVGEIEKAILKADIGLAPSNDGNLIRINIPALTEDRRKELTKV